MQVLDTHIGNVIDGMVTVEFRGEGGELVSVRMASDGSLEGDAAVRHAKAVLVQVTAFGADPDVTNDEVVSDEGDVTLAADADSSLTSDFPTETAL